MLVVSFTANLFLNAAPVYAQATSVSQVQEAADVWSLQLPKEIGRVETFKKFDSSEKTLVLIQDAHAVADAQFSIKKILHEISLKNVRLTALEGTSGDLDTLLLRAFPDREILEETIHDYVAKGELAGSAAAAILNPEEMKYTGVEDGELYRRAIDLFLEAQDRRAEFEGKTARLEKELISLQKTFNSPKASRLLALLESFEREPENMTEIFYRLQKIEKLSKETYPHLTPVYQELKSKKSENAPALEKELDFLIAQFLKQTKNRAKAQVLNKQIQDFQTGRIAFSALASFLLNTAEEEGIDLGPSLPLREQARLHETLESIRGPEFFKEFESYAASLKKKVFTAEEEWILDGLKKHIASLKKLSALELSREQWAEFQAANKNLSAEHLSKTDGRVRRFAADTAAETDRLLNEFSSHAEFYRNAVLREETILKKTLAAMAENKTDSAALVLGGFHTEGFLELLDRKKISYLLVTPSIHRLPSENVYKAGMRGEVSWKSYFISKDGEIDLYDAFSRAASEKLTANFKQKNGESAAVVLKKWRDRVLTELAGENRIAEARAYSLYVDRLNFQNSGKSKKEKIELTWKKITAQFLGRVKELKNQNALSPENLAGWKPSTAQGWNYIPLARGVRAKSSWVRGPVSETKDPAARAEVRLDKSIDYATVKKLDRVKNATVISLQMEMGYSAGFLQAVEKKYGKQTADRVSQATLTGGLGALMHDLFPSWKANGMDIIGIHPIWEEIKKKPYPEGPLNLGQYQREIMEEEMARRGEEVIEYTVELDWDDDYKRYAEENEKAKNAYGRKIHVRALKEYTSQYGAPNYHLDAYYLKDEAKPDTEENRQRIFDTVYSDDHPAWRDYHLAAYARASEQLIKILKQKGIVKPKTVEIHNEVFVSMPKKEEDADRTLVHINHSAYLPTIYSPNVKSFGLLGFPEWMRPYIVKEGNSISIVDFAALNYDMLTGVAIDEHYWVLRRNIFRNAGGRLDHYNDGEIRSTNGVLTEHWQSEPLQDLIEHFRVLLGLPEKVDSAVFYKTLEQNESLRREFVIRQEFIKSAESANFLKWMADIQKQPAWLEEALRESGKTRDDFDAFFQEIQTAARSNDTEAWERIKTNHAALRDHLLSHPMVSNARRQVPYKGPEKWLEVLNSLRDAGKLEAFKATKVRVIIGGRTFSAQADEEFQAMKRIVSELGLQNHFAFIEDYNVFDAAIMFRAMAGVVMLSDEFLEASATSMMKGVVNGAALIGVWGGAMPELFKLIDEEGQVIDIFEKKVPHNLVIKNLRSGKWKLVNGYMVRYSRDISKQDGGGRRPDAEALASSLKWLNEQYADPEKRRELLWQSVSGTPKVDMREGQARAHMQLIERLLTGKEETQRDIFDAMTFEAGDYGGLLDDKGAPFIWRRNGGDDGVLKPGKAFPSGIFGLVSMFREISTYGYRDERGKAAMEAVRHHALRGDFFNFMLDELKDAPASLKPFVEAIEKLAAEAAPLPKALQAIQADPEKEDEYLVGLTKLTDLNIRAMELIEKLGIWIAAKSFETYLTNNDAAVTETIHTAIFSNSDIKKYLARYLDRHEKATPLYTRNSLIRAYGIIHNGEPFVFSINLGADPTVNRTLPQNKAYTEIPMTASMQNFLKKFIPQYQRMSAAKRNLVFQVLNAKTGQAYSRYDLINPETVVVLGVPAPEGVQLLKLKNTGTLFSQLLMTPRAQTFNTANLKNFLASLQEAADDGQGGMVQERVDETIREIAEILPETARAQFGEYLPRMMGLIAVLSPRYLDDIKDWDPLVYAALKKAAAQNKKLFAEGRIAIHKTSREQTVVISRSITQPGAKFSDQNILFALEFSKDGVSPHDGKVPSRVLDLKPIALEPTHEYDVSNALTGAVYQTVRTGAEYMDGWPIRVPVLDMYEGNQKTQQGWGIDVYHIRSVTPRFDLVREPAVEPIPNLFLGLNMLDLGATFDSAAGTVTVEGGLAKLNQFIPVLTSSGVGTVYLYGGLFEVGKISQKLHSVDTDGLHWLSDTADGTLPRVLVSVNGYATKQVGNLRDNHGNAFSPLDLETTDPRHATAGVKGADDSAALLEQAVTGMRAKNISAVFDFVFWRAPESVNEKNYKQYFYRELTAEEQEDWDEARTDEDRLKVMKNLTRSGGHFVVRIKENDKERLILVQHMYYEPGRDQAVRNPFNPEVIAQSKREIELAIDRGARGIRIDLAHKLLNSDLKPMMELYRSINWLTDPSGAYRPDYEPLRDLIEHGKRYAKSKGRDFYVIAEAYMNYHHDRLLALGVDAVYYENPHKDYKELARGNNGISARNLGEGLRTALESKKLFVFPANFDVEPLKEAQGSREAFLMGMVVLAAAGVPTMIDARELMDQIGQLVPIPGREHPFPTAEEIRKRRDFLRFIWQFMQSQYVELAREFQRAVNGRKVIKATIVDNENRDQFISLRVELESESGQKEYLTVILNIKPFSDRIIWSEGLSASEAVDVQTGESFKAEGGRTLGIPFPANIQYRILTNAPAKKDAPKLLETADEQTVRRSELRFAQDAADAVLTDLALQRPITETAAEKVSAAASQPGFEEAFLTQSADPRMLDLYAASSVAGTGTERIREFYERHPGYENEAEIFWQNKIQEMSVSAREHLASSSRAELNFSFAMPLPESPKIREWFLRYVNMIADLRAYDASRVKGAIRVLATEAQIHDPALREFWREAGRTGIVKPLETGTRSTAYHLETFLNEHGNAMVYGAEDLGVQPKNKIRVVKSSQDINPETVFTVAGLLTFELAGVQGVIADSLLRQIPDLLPGVGYSSERLEIQHRAMELVYQQLRAGRMFSISA